MKQNFSNRFFLTVVGSSLILVIAYYRTTIQQNSDHVLSNVTENPHVHMTIHTRVSSYIQSIQLKIRTIFIYFRSLLMLSLIHSCGCLVPSILSIFYILVCLGLALWWALGKNFTRAYLWIIRLLQFYTIFHLLMTYVMQLPFIEQYLLESNIRLLGLTSLYKHSCSNNQNDRKHNWIVYLHPLIILTLYWFSIYEYYLTRKYKQRLKSFLIQSTLTETHSQIKSSVLSEYTIRSTTIYFHSLVDFFWIEPSYTTSLNENISYKTNSLLVALFSYILSRAYMLSVISMFLWSITYHSYLTFIYLILACFIWLLPNTKYWCHFFSIYFCIYAYILLIINYINLLNIIRKEFLWPLREIKSSHTHDKNLNRISMSIYFRCTIKFIYTLLLLLSLRQKVKEASQKKHKKNASINVYEHIELMPPVCQLSTLPTTSSIFHLDRIFTYIKFQLSSIYSEIYYIIYMGYARIWTRHLFFLWSRLFTTIIVFILSLNMHSLPISYRIIYMGFFLQYHLCYSISKNLWNNYLFPFYLTLVIYSMIVLFTIYIYQFEELQIIKTSICFKYMKCELLLSLMGIRLAHNNILIRELFPPIIIIICIVMHMKFFHRQKRKNSLNSLININEISSLKIFKLIQWFENRFKKIQHIFWCVCELFIYKILLLMICFCLTKQTNICITNLILVFIFVISLFSSLLQNAALGVYALVSTLNILTIMIIQSELFSSLGYINNICLTSFSNMSNELHMNTFDSKHIIAPLEWFGLQTKTTSNATVAQLITPYLCVVLGISTLQLVRRHRHRSLSLIELLYSTHISLFPNINIKSMNDSLWNKMKYLCNYGSYRFGLELTCFAILCLIIIRMDAIAIIHALILLVCLLLRRQYVRKFWKLYRIYASISVVWLYFNALGLPPILCLQNIFDYSISFLFHKKIWLQIKAYFYLSNDLEWRPVSEHLFFDLSLLIILAIQENNFKLEQQEISIHQIGSNDDEHSISYHPNMIHDFITNIQLSWSNRFVSYFYSYMYWFIIAYLYIIATYRQSLFYLLILFNCFFLLWHGQTFLQRSFHRQKLFLRFLTLSLFTLFLSHLFMQPLSCILMYYASMEYRCFLINYFYIPCSIKLFRQYHASDCPMKNSSTYITEKNFENKYKQSYCEENFYNNSMAIIYTQNEFYCQSEHQRLTLDLIGFLLVLIFIRLLHSYSFFYVRLELQIQAELSQMGASLLSQLNWLKLIEYQQKTANELENIKARVTQIRQRRSTQKREADIDEPIYHHPAILSGDYYMFDASESSTSVIPTKACLTESQNTISLIDIFDWKTQDYINNDKSLPKSSAQECNTSQLNDEFVEHHTLKNSSCTSNQSTSNVKNLSIGIDLSSIMTFFQLKQNSDKIRRALDTMNSRLIIYIGQRIRTLLIITQVISDAKLYLKYPTETARIITSTIPENINDYIIKAGQHLSSSHKTSIVSDTSRPIKQTLSSFNLTSSMNSKITVTSNKSHYSTKTHTSSMTRIEQDEIHTSKQKPISMIDSYLENFKNNRHHIESNTILLTFIMSKFDYLTYLTLIINFLASGAALIWLPLLASIYFWAILTFPYPSRRFWYVITLSSMTILFIQYIVVFISPFSKNSYRHHSLIGHLNIIANVMLLIILSFHRIVLHQLGLWDNYRPSNQNSLLLDQNNSITSNTKLFQNKIIQEIYEMFKNKKLENMNFNAMDEENSQIQQKLEIPSILSMENLDSSESKISCNKKTINNYIKQMKRLIHGVKFFYSFAIACPIVPKVDHYSSMFLCDFIVIFLIIAGHQRFSKLNSVQDNIIYRYIQGSSSLDITPIVMLLIQFLLIIVDRIIYLKKHVHIKFYFLCFQFVVLHLWLMIIYPIWFQHEMSTNWAAVLIYIFKSFYFMLSALQIRHGYPTRILGNFLTKRYTILRLLCYKFYCIIPFLYEMRVLMDWMFIPTSLSLTYYFMMEEIARNAWIQKCWRVTYARSPTIRAKNRGRCERYCIGGWILFAIIFVIWFPLVFFSISTSLADPIPIDRCEIKIRLSNYKELYELITTNIQQPTTDQFFNEIHPLIINSSFLSSSREFTRADISCIHIPGRIGTQWSLSSSAFHQLKEELRSYIDNRSQSEIPQINFDYSFIRKGQTNEQDILPSGYISTLSETHQVSLTKQNAILLLNMLISENQTQTILLIAKLMPKFLHLLPDMIDKQSSFHAQDVQLILRRNKQVLWWDISELVTNDWKNKCSFDPQALNLITISERAGAQSKSFNIISKLLIGNSAKLTLIGVYAGLVYVLWLTCFRQTLFSEIQLIMYHEWPFADRVEKLCEEVYLVRELGELQLEEELFAQLIFLHRSPETLIQFTRPTNLTKHYRNEHLHQN